MIRHIPDQLRIHPGMVADDDDERVVIKNLLPAHMWKRVQTSCAPTMRAARASLKRRWWRIFPATASRAVRGAKRSPRTASALRSWKSWWRSFCSGVRKHDAGVEALMPRGQAPRKCGRGAGNGALRLRKADGGREGGRAERGAGIKKDGRLSPAVLSCAEELRNLRREGSTVGVEGRSTAFGRRGKIAVKAAQGVLVEREIRFVQHLNAVSVFFHAAVTDAAELERRNGAGMDAPRNVLNKSIGLLGIGAEWIVEKDVHRGAVGCFQEKVNALQLHVAVNNTAADAYNLPVVLRTKLLAIALEDIRLTHPFFRKRVRGIICWDEMYAAGLCCGAGRLRSRRLWRFLGQKPGVFLLLAMGGFQAALNVLSCKANEKIFRGLSDGFGGIRFVRVGAVRGMLAAGPGSEVRAVLAVDPDELRGAAGYLAKKVSAIAAVVFLFRRNRGGANKAGNVINGVISIHAGSFFLRRVRCGGFSNVKILCHCALSFLFLQEMMDFRLTAGLSCVKLSTFSSGKVNTLTSDLQKPGDYSISHP